MLSFSLIFNKLKAIGPIGIIGISVLVTIKLLTAQTPQNSQELKVSVEEDISLVDFKDEIEFPPEPQPEIEEEPEAPPEDEEVVDEEDAESDNSSFEQQEDEPEEKEDKEEEKPKSNQRKWKPESSNPLVGLFQKLLPKKKE